MQRMNLLAMGAFSLTLATTGLAQQPAEELDPAPQTGSAAPADPSMNRSTPARGTSAQGAGASATSGTNRMQIEQMQRELAARGLYQGAIDGISGPQTMAALRQFQQQQGLPQSGGLDAMTRQALGIQLDKQPVSGAQTASGPELERPVGREGATSGVTGMKPMRSQVELGTLTQDQLRTLQTRLQELGFYQGQADGIMGEGTRAALRQFFQTQADLASNGIITDATIGVFGVSPQGLNGSTPNATTRGSQPRNSSAGSSRSGNSSNPSGTSGTPTGTPRTDMRTPNGTTPSPNGSTTPPPSGSGTNAPQQSGTTPR